jgi:hypothetical protein
MPRSLHERIKAVAAVKGVSFSDLAQEWLEQRLLDGAALTSIAHPKGPGIIGLKLRKAAFEEVEIDLKEPASKSFIGGNRG